MTCKDCLHADVCSKYCEFQSDEGCCYCRIGACNYTNNAEKCPMFTDKSRFVELSCRLRDKVWVISEMLDRANGGFKRIVCEGEIYKLSYSSLTTPTEWIGYEYDSPLYGQITGFDRIDLCLGKTVFLTREEAEAEINKKEKENGNEL